MHHDHTPASAAAPEDVGGLPVVYCPECGMPAWVEWRDAMGSSSDAVVYVKVRCFARHWFLTTEEQLTPA